MNFISVFISVRFIVDVTPHGFCDVKTQLAKLLMLIALDTVSIQLTLALRYPRPISSHTDKGLIKIIILTAWPEIFWSCCQKNTQTCKLGDRLRKIDAIKTVTILREWRREILFVKSTFYHKTTGHKIKHLCFL